MLLSKNIINPNTNRIVSGSESNEAMEEYGSDEAATGSADPYERKTSIKSLKKGLSYSQNKLNRNLQLGSS